MGSSQNVALDAEHDLARFRIEKTGLQPRAMVLKNLFGEAWKELAEIKKRRFLFDDLMDATPPSLISLAMSSTESKIPITSSPASSCEAAAWR
jgi:hypothetical protein